MVQVLERCTDGLQERESSRSFFDAIGRPDLKEKITPQSPIVSFSMEAAIPDGSYAGGLGILERCKYFQAGKDGIPYVLVTPVYATRGRQEGAVEIGIYGTEENRFRSYHREYPFDPEGSAWGTSEWNQDVLVRTNGHTTRFGLFTQEAGSAKVFGLFEPGIGSLYQAAQDSSHRMYQQVVLGFGGFRSLQAKGIKPSVYLINESASVFVALANLDDTCNNGVPFEQALESVRGETMYINHTLEQAAEAEVSRDILEEYAIGNMTSLDAANWLRGLIDGNNGIIRLNTLALALSGTRLGVSKLHTQIANGERETAEGILVYFKDHEGNKIKFEHDTNGIFMETWVQEGFMNLYKKEKAIDVFDLPTPDYQERIDGLDGKKLREIKEIARRELREFLTTRKDQYGEPIKIEEGAKIASWAKRFVDYKRPHLLFNDVRRLAYLLESENMHILMSGKYGGDNFSHIFGLVDKNPVLKKRVHFVQGYDVDVAQKMVTGSDVWLNTPVVGKEACGTSWMKAIGNLTILISTEDGGVADITPPAYLEIGGDFDSEQQHFIYSQLVRAARIVDDKDEDSTWTSFTKGQLKAYLPVISGARMMRDYILKGFPEESQESRVSQDVEETVFSTNGHGYSPWVNGTVS